VLRLVAEEKSGIICRYLAQNLSRPIGASVVGDDDFVVSGLQLQGILHPGIAARNDRFFVIARYDHTDIRCRQKQPPSIPGVFESLW